MIRKIGTVWLFIILTAFVTPAKKNIRGEIVCFVDSITYGAKVDDQSWVWVLSQKYTDVHFINAGRSGRKTSDKEELLPVLKQHPTADYFLIFLGVNDLKDGTDLMVNNCIINTQWMISKVRETNAKTKIVLLAPTDINLETMNENNVNKKYNEHTKQSLYSLEIKLKKLAKDEHTGFISLLHAVSPSNYADGLHPDKEGQKEIAKAVWKGLKKIK